MKKNIVAIITGFENITIELDDTNSPKTCASFLTSLPFSVNAHIWGEEIYTDESSITSASELSDDVLPKRPTPPFASTPILGLLSFPVKIS